MYCIYVNDYDTSYSYLNNESGAVKIVDACGESLSPITIKNLYLRNANLILIFRRKKNSDSYRA